jgi:GAF domain-containing protein
MPRDRCVSASVPERFARRRDELLESRRRSRRGPFVKSRLKLARQLMDTLSDEWDPKEFKDTYTDVLRQVIEVKVEGKEVVAPEMPKRERVTNLIEALLRRSLHRRSSPSGSPADCSGRRRWPPAARVAGEALPVTVTPWATPTSGPRLRVAAGSAPPAVLPPSASR